MLIVEYDGARFSGWQVQPNARTGAGVLTSALVQALGEEDVHLVGAGRTDEGVHAEGQVCNFLTKSRIPAATIVREVNEILPSDLKVVRAQDVGPRFHSRHSAISRVYRYHVATRPSVFLRGHAWFLRRKCSLKKVEQATKLVEGFHDFASFCDMKLVKDGSTTVDVTHASWKELKDQYVFRMAGSHFLPRMVRRVVGSLVAVGTGEISLDTFKSWLETRHSESARLTAPAMGLYLEHVEYPPEAMAVDESATGADEGHDEPVDADEPDETSPVARRALAALEAAEEE
jgi:tRNA pseudouridine38-40 synthase